jgi:hypothetical protein
LCQVRLPPARRPQAAAQLHCSRRLALDPPAWPQANTPPHSVTAAQPPSLSILPAVPLRSPDFLLCPRPGIRRRHGRRPAQLRAAGRFTVTIDDVASSAFTHGRIQAGGLRFAHNGDALGFDDAPADKPGRTRHYHHGFTPSAATFSLRPVWIAHSLLSSARRRSRPRAAPHAGDASQTAASSRKRASLSAVDGQTVSPGPSSSPTSALATNAGAMRRVRPRRARDSGRCDTG